MEFKGTKGTWEYIGGDNSSIDIVLQNNTTISIDRYNRYGSELIGTREEMEANALLISKSPEILEMLKEFYGVVRIYNENNVLPQYITNEMAKAYKLIKEATEI
jgi:hypothetical protein